MRKRRRQISGSRQGGEAIQRQTPTSRISAKLLDQVLIGIRERLERGDIIRKALCQQAGISPSYLSRLLSEGLSNRSIPSQTLKQIVSALEQSALFMSSALPQKVFPPLFNRYDAGDQFGFHVDNAIRQVPQTLERVRTDLSATLFLTRPEDYEGGELVIEDTYGVHSIKLPAGHLILYPASSLHEVRPVTRGTRIASFFWIQSMVRDDGKRTLLFDLDVAIQRISNEIQNQAARVQLTSIYHNLLRRWAEL